VTISLLSSQSLKLKNYHRENSCSTGQMLSSFTYNMVKEYNFVIQSKIKQQNKFLKLSNKQLLKFHPLIMELIILKMLHLHIKMVGEQDHGYIKVALSLVTSKLIQKIIR
jgi:hypothetical protein